MFNPCMNAIKHKNKGLVCVAREQAEVCLGVKHPEPITEISLAKGRQRGGCGCSARCEDKGDVWATARYYINNHEKK